MKTKISWFFLFLFIYFFLIFGWFLIFYSLHITEAFQTDTPVSSVKMESIQRPQEAASAIATSTTATSSSSLVQSLDRQKTRKLSSTSTTSRPSTAASKNTRSRSRSSSKERLLETLAGSDNAPQTSHEEDEVAGENEVPPFSYVSAGGGRAVGCHSQFSAFKYDGHGWVVSFFFES